ncbi:hypothetical protein NA56DRAFT_745130 [Hyaloscypha hepaticicola]|uniref:Uncharacterized protein n=1 Tax=Hyaloscypha hepaticicola TaxID=2082293 RepID=A0A2J6QGD7_9HELO|nr:hypothetical protein NA56DRAFT_745130 [Hyaloscypha hepaticicola]
MSLMSDVCVSGLGRREFVAAWRGLAARESHEITSTSRHALLRRKGQQIESGRVCTFAAATLRSSIPLGCIVRQLVERRLELYLPQRGTVPTVGPRFIASTSLTASCARLDQGFAVNLPTCPFAPDLSSNTPAPTPVLVSLLRCQPPVPYSTQRAEETSPKRASSN